MKYISPLKIAVSQHSMWRLYNEKNIVFYFLFLFCILQYY
jgi:hypothetical protein